MGDNLVQVNWDTHKQILFGNLSTLREEQIHTDVTLSCEGNFYPAHKLVLTMCSGYFAKAFQYAPNSSPIFFLCGIKKETVEALLSFIYNGTVTIPSDEVEDMAKAGNFLQIEELSQIASIISSKTRVRFSNDDVTVQQNSGSPRKMEPMVLLKREVIDKIIKKSADLLNERKDEYKEQNTNGKKYTEVVAKDPFEVSHDGSSSDYEFEGWHPSAVRNTKLITKSLLSVISGKKKFSKKKICFKCKMQFDSQSQLIEHFTSDHKNLIKKHYCKRCKKIFKFKKSFQKHKQLLNCGRKFCTKCSYSSMSFEDFKAHLQSHRNESVTINDSQVINGVDSLETKYDILENFDNPYKKKRKFSHKALNDALKAISTDFEKFSNDSCYDEYDNIDQCSSPEYSPPFKMQKTRLNCLLCELTFDNSRQFNFHKQTDCKLLECHFCLKVFIKEKKVLLEDHQKRHKLVSKPYSCPYCSFISDDQLVRDQHLEKHTRKD